MYIPEAYVDKVDLKRPVTFIFNAIPGQTHSANISRSANALSNMRSEALEVDIDNKTQTLKPGMYAEVKIPLLWNNNYVIFKIKNVIYTNSYINY